MSGDEGNREQPGDTAPDGETVPDTGTAETDASVTGSTDVSADDGEEWRYSIDELDDRTEDDGASADGDDSGGNIAGEMFDLEEELEPGSPSVESTLFVVLGALTTVLFVLTAAGVI